MSIVCVDASLPLQFLLGDTWSDASAVIWREWTEAGLEIAAPPLFRAEVTSVVRERVYRNEFSRAEGDAALSISLGWPVTISAESTNLQRRAFAFASQYNRPKAYDAQYLALAEILGCELWTADERLYNTVGKDLPWVKWIGAST